MATKQHVAAVLLMAFAVFCVTAGQTRECKRGGECFPGMGRVPEGVGVNSLSYYCCPEKNMSKSSVQLPDGTVNCSCFLDLTVEHRVQEWADSSKDEGRMCIRECGGSKRYLTVSDRFLYCCWPLEVNGVRVALGMYVTKGGDSEEYIGCRCQGSPVPDRGPGAYVVPETRLYNSTGESCSYDQACDERPSLTCRSSKVTFCCYGSRGMVTSNDGFSVTRCTCTNQVYGEMCEQTPVSIAETSLPCHTNCSSRNDEGGCVDENNNPHCCPNNLAVSANTSPSTCTCTTARKRSCDPTSFAVTLRLRPTLLLVLVVSASVVSGQLILF